METLKLIKTVPFFHSLTDWRSRFAQFKFVDESILHIGLDTNLINTANGNGTNIDCFIDANERFNTSCRIDRRSKTFT